MRGQLFNASISIPSTEQSPNLKYRRENDEPNTHDWYSKHEERLYLHIYAQRKNANMAI